MRPLTLALAALLLTANCAGSYLVPLNGQSDPQCRADGKECRQHAVAAGNDARTRMQESICRANDRKTTDERAGELAGTVALALVVPSFLQPAPHPRRRLRTRSGRPARGRGRGARRRSRWPSWRSRT
jgi:hypothetical protein